MTDQKDQREQLEQESAFAKMGQQVVNNEAFKQAMVIRERQIFEVFCSTKADQSDIREEAWRTMVNLRALQGFLKRALETGKMADETLEILNKTGEAKKQK